MGAAPQPEKVPTTMAAMLLTGHGDIDKLVYQDDVAVPQPGPPDLITDHAVVQPVDLVNSVQRPAVASLEHQNRRIHLLLASPKRPPRNT